MMTTQEHVLVLTWENALFSSGALRRDLERCRRNLGGPGGRPLEYETAAGATIRYVPVNGRRETAPQLVPPEWHGEVPPNLYARFIDAEPWFEISEEERGGPRINVPIVAIGDHEVTLKLARHSVIDLVAERGEKDVPAGHQKLDVYFPDFWPDLFLWDTGVLEAYFEWAQLRYVVAEAGKGHLQKALAVAEARSAERSAALTLPTEMAFWEMLVTDDEDPVLWKADIELGIAARSWKELRESGTFQNAVNHATPVTVVFGWVGYMWWELVRDLRTGFVPRQCRHCGRAFVPRRHGDRAYCNAAENPECIRSRNGLRAKKSRNQKLSQQT